MSASKLDAVYRSILLTRFFTKGWGKPENLRRLFEFRKVVSNRDECLKLIDRDYPVTITKDQKMSDCRLLEGYFTTPLEKYLPGIVPEVAQKAHFQAILPLHWPQPGVKPMCLHLAGTGDHHFWRRRNLMVKPLLKEAGIGGIILENPFYGLRKPVDQVRSSLHNVSDIFVMGGCLILESLVLFHWCERNGLGPLGVTGLSMGGHMASLAATNWPKPLVLVPCLSWSTASAVFLQGVMSQSINWDLLEDQFLSDGIYREKLSKMVTIVDDAFLAGKKFAQTLTHSKIDTLSRNESLQKTDKKVDVTYNENSKNVSKVTPTEKSKSTYTLEKLRYELNKLVEEGKLDRELFEKLTSDETFALNAKDIYDINKLNEQQIKEMLLKYKIVELMTPSTSTTETDTKPAPTKETLPTEHIVKKPAENPPKVVSTTEVKAPEKKPAPTETGWLNLSFLRSKPERKIDISKIHWRDREALQFMRGIMDECTHLSNFSVPFDTSLIIAVCAKHDAYVPREDVGTLEEIWPGATVKYVDAGHVSAYILHQSLFRSCIKEAFEKSKSRWRDGKHID